MSEINKLLWFLLTLSINGLISIIISQIDSKRTLKIICCFLSHNVFSMYLLGFL